MCVLIEILVVLCLLVGMFFYFVVSDILVFVLYVVFGDVVLDYKFLVWYGFNLFLLMSFIVICCGVFIYV